MELSEVQLENRNPQTGTSAPAVPYEARFTLSDLLLADDHEHKDVSLPASQRLKASSWQSKRYGLGRNFKTDVQLYGRYSEAGMCIVNTCVIMRAYNIFLWHWPTTKKRSVELKVYREKNSYESSDHHGIEKEKIKKTFQVDFPKVKSTRHYIAHNKSLLGATSMAQRTFIIQRLPRKLDCSFHLDWKNSWWSLLFQEHSRVFYHQWQARFFNYCLLWISFMSF